LTKIENKTVITITVNNDSLESSDKSDYKIEATCVQCGLETIYEDKKPNNLLTDQLVSDIAEFLNDSAKCEYCLKGDNEN
jgi:hypothetical protein